MVTGLRPATWEWEAVVLPVGLCVCARPVPGFGARTSILMYIYPKLNFDNGILDDGLTINMDRQCQECHCQSSVWDEYTGVGDVWTPMSAAVAVAAVVMLVTGLRSAI